ncbi:MAG: gliding motility protein GldN [Fluviicola sp.]|nr:MAG: gliding motility protein GldN [Fluviicola sp.]
MNYFLSIFLILPLLSSAQYGPIPEANGVRNGLWSTEHIPTKRLIQYPPVSERDVLWSKRIWRAIDMREKINQPMYYPLDEVTSLEWITNASRWSLWTIIRKHVMNGDLRVFSPYNPNSYGLGAVDGDQLKYPIDPLPGENYYTDANFRSDILYYLGRLGPESDIPLVDEYGEPMLELDENGNESFVYEAPDTVWYNSKDIVEYRLKEDWFFDKQRGEMDVRIIAIAPVVYDTELDINGNEQITGKKELFWLYFPHCRYVFNNYFTYNDKNDTQWMSFDDLFWKRRFSSYIYKESNSFDRPIDSYAHGAEALYESERISNEIRTFEHDLWSF